MKQNNSTLGVRLALGFAVFLALAFSVTAINMSGCLESYYNMNQSDNITHDYGRLNNNGTVSGNVAFDSSCLYDGCYDFTEGKILLGDLPELYKAYKSFSVTAWIYFDYSTGAQSIFSKHATNEGYDGMIFGINDGFDIRYYLQNAAGAEYMQVYSYPTVYSKSAWHFVGFVIDRDTQEGLVYVDGAVVLNKSLTLANSAINTTDDFLIGSRAGGTQYFTGEIDEFALFNCSITSDNISEWYADYDLSWLYPPPPPVPNILYYEFEPANNTELNSTPTIFYYNISINGLCYFEQNHSVIANKTGIDLMNFTYTGSFNGTYSINCSDIVLDKFITWNISYINITSLSSVECDRQYIWILFILFALFLVLEEIFSSLILGLMCEFVGWLFVLYIPCYTSKSMQIFFGFLLGIYLIFLIAKYFESYGDNAM